MSNDKPSTALVKNPERSLRYLEKIMKDDNLKSIWKMNEESIDEDIFHLFTPIERTQYLMAKTIVDDLVKMLSDLSPDERFEEVHMKVSIYQRLSAMMKLIMEMEDKARIRAQNTKEPDVRNPFEDMTKIHAENEHEEINFERKRKIIEEEDVIEGVFTEI